jgi:hypothetical protein
MNELEELIKAFVSNIQKMRVTSQNYPQHIETDFQLAAQEKRNGNYLNSINLYKKIIENEGIVYISVLNGIFKPIAAAGYLREAKILLEIGNKVMSKNSTGIGFSFGLPNRFKVHLNRMAKAVTSERELIYYLKSISENKAYDLPRTFNKVIRDYYE